MKKLIWLTPLLSFPLLAASGDGPEIVNSNDNKQIVSFIKDVEVKGLLEGSGEFKNCRDKYKFEANDPNKDSKLDAAEKCFRDELAKVKDPKKLQQLSDSLKLQQYGLVQSNNVKEIQNYLSDKLYESLTGIKRSEANKKALIESMKFKNKKHIDQKVFFELYKTQLGKNALYEISRFCMEDFRLESSPGNTFVEHWKNYDPNAALNISDVTDTGTPKFLTKFSDTTKKEMIYDDIFKSINGPNTASKLSDDQLSKFFMYCGQAITPLCNEFERTQRSNGQAATSSVGATTPTKGAAACLAKSRIRSFKQALANADKVIEQFKEMSADNATKLLMGDKVHLYADGTDPNEKSIDELTTHSSTDLLEGSLSDSNLEKKAQECQQNPTFDGCEAFISKGDTLDKSKHKLELELTLKREVELARVRELKAKDAKDLKQYLEDNGYWELVKDFDNLTQAQIEDAISKSFDAQKNALLAEINDKLGKRQVSENTTTLQKADVDKVIQDSKEEKARLAQVVLFNNIITSHLTLKKKDASGKLQDAGRNTKAWQVEEQALKNAKVDESLFSSLKASDSGNGGSSSSTERVNNYDFNTVLDSLLGKATQP